jgi:hypothetical protein
MQTCTNQTISWLECSWNTFGARTNHGQTWTYKTHHNSDLEEATTFPFIVFSMPNHRTCTQMSFCPKLGVPKFLKLELLQLSRPITSWANLLLKWSLKQSCSPHQELSKDTWYVICTQVNQGNSQLLVFGSQILVFGIWLPTLFLAPTYILSTQMAHASLF